MTQFQARQLYKNCVRLSIPIQVVVKEEVKQVALIFAEGLELVNYNTAALYISGIARYKASEQDTSIQSLGDLIQNFLSHQSQNTNKQYQAA